MRSYLHFTLLILFILAPALPVSGQEASRSRFDRAELRSGAAEVPMDVPAPRVEAADDAVGGGLFSTRSIIHAVGGAIVGSWIGLFGAQVVHSDWDENRDGDFGTRRVQWATAGALVGLLGSRLITRTTPPGPGPLPVRSERNRNVILADEIARSRATNAYQLVANERKEWLVPRGTNSLTETSAGFAEGNGRSFTIQVVEGRDKIIVYMDDIRIGGPEDMKDIPMDGINKVEFIDARRATYLYGAGHTHGVIRLSTKVEVPHN